jgi:hypothetical protein
MHVNRSLLGWGVFLILLGVVPLAVRQGAVDESVVAGAWQLWPLFLVGAGIGLVLRGTRFELVGGLVVAVTLGLIGGSIIATGLRIPAVGGCGIGDGAGTAFATQRGNLSASARVELDLNCGSLDVRTVAGAAWMLDGSDDDGQGPNVSASGDRLRIESSERDGFSFGDGDEWRVQLPSDAELRLDLTLNAGDATLDLASARVPEISASVNAASMDLDLGAAASVGRLTASVNAGAMSITLPAQTLSGSISANAGSIELCIPADVGIRLRTEENLTASYDVERAGLVRIGNAWESPGYASASATVDLSASANAGSIVLNPEDGCGE